MDTKTATMGRKRRAHAGHHVIKTNNAAPTAGWRPDTLASQPQLESHQKLNEHAFAETSADPGTTNSKYILAH